MNSVCLSGRVSDYGPKISWTEGGKPQTTFTLVVEEPGREGSTFKTFVPIKVVGAQAESCAETLDAGALIAVNGKLQYSKTGGKEAKEGKLTVVTYGVERLATGPQDAPALGQSHTQGDAWGPGPTPEPKKGKPRYPTWHAPAEVTR